MVVLENKLSNYVLEFLKLSRHNPYVYRWLSRPYPFETKCFAMAQEIYTNLLLGGVAFAKVIDPEYGNISPVWSVVDNQSVKVIPRKSTDGKKRLISPASDVDLNTYDQIGPVMHVPPLWPLIRILQDSRGMKNLGKPDYDWEKLKEFEKQIEECLKIPSPEEDVYALLVRDFLKRHNL